MFRTFTDFVWNDGFKMSIEELNNDRFVHIEVYKNTPRTIRKIKRVWERLKGISVEDNYDSLYAYTSNYKFAKLIDPSYEVIHTLVYDEVYYEVLKWDITK